MDFITAGSILGAISSVIHLGQGMIHIFKHFKLTSTCCDLKSSLEIDIDSPVRTPARTENTLNNNGNHK